MVAEVDAPVNVLLRPGGPSVAELADLGVARISVGGAFAFACLGALEKAARGLLDGESHLVGRHGRGRQARPPRLRGVMSYTGTEGETSAVFRRDLDPLMLGTTAATFVAPGSVTNGEFGLFRWDIPARTPAVRARHFHRGFSESFYVVSGTVTLYNGEAWNPLPAGGFCYVPPRWRARLPQRRRRAREHAHPLRARDRPASATSRSWRRSAAPAPSCPSRSGPTSSPATTRSTSDLTCVVISVGTRAVRR